MALLFLFQKKTAARLEKKRKIGYNVTINLSGVMKMYDVAVIGAGVTGSMTARLLSFTGLKTIV